MEMRKASVISVGLHIAVLLLAVVSFTGKNLLGVHATGNLAGRSS
jgi:hypothetical protein